MGVVGCVEILNIKKTSILDSELYEVDTKPITSLNTIIDSLNSVLSEINTAFNQVFTRSSKVSDGSQALSQGAKETTALIEGFIKKSEKVLKLQIIQPMLYIKY